MTVLEKLKAINAIIFSANAESENTEENVDINFVDVKTADNRILRVSDMVVDATVEEILEDGTIQPVENGDYILDNGVTITVVDGLIKEIIDAQETPEAEAEAEVEVEVEVEDDSTETSDMIEYPLADGSIINVAGELVEGALTDAPDGDHTLADGTIITVVDGVITKITAAVQEEMEVADVVTEDAPVVVTEDAPVVDETEDEKEMKGVLANLKELIKQVKELKASFEVVEKENKELKAEFSKIKSQPSAEKTDTKMSFSEVTKNENTKYSPIKAMFGNK